MRRRIFGTAALICSLLVAASIPVSFANAAQPEPKNKGLFITPLRTYPAVNPNDSTTDSLTIANITDNPMDVSLSVQQFSVANYTYDYQFRAAKEDWLKLGVTQTQLAPNKSQKVSYTIAPPKDATPGGHYFTILATTTLTSGNITSKVQAATVVYLTVNGDLRRTSLIQNGKVPRISFGRPISFTFDAKNTGNTHFFVYTKGQLQGWSAKGKSPETTHLLFPDTIRGFSGTIPPPILPGIYTAVFGYTTDTGQTLQGTQRLVYVPPWSLAIAVGATWIGIMFWHRRKKKRITFY